MAAITITIPAGTTNRVLDAIAAREGYTGFLADKVTPQTKTEFAKAWIIKAIKTSVKAYEADIAIDSAKTTAMNDVETNIVIT